MIFSLPIRDTQFAIPVRDRHCGGFCQTPPLDHVFLYVSWNMTFPATMCLMNEEKWCFASLRQESLTAPIAVAISCVIRPQRFWQLFPILLARQFPPRYNSSESFSSRYFFLFDVANCIFLFQMILGWLFVMDKSFPGIKITCNFDIAEWYAGSVTFAYVTQQSPQLLISFLLFLL